MKILMWPSYYLPSIGGLELMTHRLVECLRGQNHDVCVIANYDSVMAYHTFFPEGVTVHAFPFIRALQQGSVANIKRMLQKIQVIIKAFQPDIIHVHGWGEGFAFYQTRILSFFSVPVVLTLHGLLEQPSYHTSHCVKLLQRASAVIAVSQDVQNDFLNRGFAHKKLRVIYNGVRISENWQSASFLHQKNIVMVGRLSPEKCFDQAFYAMRLLIEKYPDMKMTLVGGGPLFGVLLALREKLNLVDVVEMTNFVAPKAVAQYLQQADIVVIPSQYESFCLVAVEAAIQGRPVVASSVNGLKEVVEDQVTGLLVPPENPEALAKAIETLLLDPTMAHRLGVAARERAMRFFSIEGATNKYIALYHTVLEAHHETTIAY